MSRVTTCGPTAVSAGHMLACPRSLCCWWHVGWASWAYRWVNGGVDRLWEHSCTWGEGRYWGCDPVGPAFWAASQTCRGPEGAREPNSESSSPHSPGPYCTLHALSIFSRSILTTTQVALDHNTYLWKLVGPSVLLKAKLEPFPTGAAVWGPVSCFLRDGFHSPSQGVFCFVLFCFL